MGEIRLWRRFSRASGHFRGQLVVATYWFLRFARTALKIIAKFGLRAFKIKGRVKFFLPRNVEMDSFRGSRREAAPTLNPDTPSPQPPPPSPRPPNPELEVEP